ncbi:transcription factor jumonji [Heterostelium album PN500]|uniref:Transcription factor jumonji n=1 Tax=Heterostelium pallidum (strain ATCC 26659 / Pp 5 / PN500) TaxID=670386 RepID=D3AZU8_HETP5|nr:transcription factor jumonji [Heterostelium album PN500]EFA84572.1 transcription factor jumonji [Heterostelium album PN500]|eukprot:XP_020436685.1 transcription factor jumonji [Heterostelium album PN500]
MKNLFYLKISRLSWVFLINFFENKECKFRNDGLGYLSVLEDTFLLEAIFDELTVPELLSLQRVSPAFYVMLNDDRLWMDAFFRETTNNTAQRGNIVYYISWKLSAVKYLYSNGRDMSAFPMAQLNFPLFQSMVIYTRWLRRHMQIKDFKVEDSGLVDKCDASLLTYEQFVERYERPSIPMVFTNGQLDWPANTEWTKQRLIERFGDVCFKISHGDHKNIPMRFADYVQYMATQNDEEPLYVFDQSFGEKAPAMLNEYKVPSKFFPEDLFQFQNDKRPHYRWIVIGPPRSGAPWHIDPAGTSAWNSLVSGCKRWLMYPPSSTPIGVSMDDVDEKFYGGPASLLWLLEVYPYLPPDQRPIEVIQYPGETIFVPGGWWHMVLNLEESIAVTQNFCDSQNFLKVCDDLIGHKKNGKEYHDFKKLLLADRPEFESKFKEFELTNSQFQHDFSDLVYWGPLVQEVFSRHFPNQSFTADDFQVASSESGQSPVFFVNRNYVVKFFCTKYGGEDSFLRERHLYSLIKDNQYLASITPSLLGSGYLLDGNFKPKKTEVDDSESSMLWKWPYIITNFFDGTSLQDVQDVPDELPFPYPPTEEEEEEDDEDEEDGEIPPTIDDKILIPMLAKLMMNIHNLPLNMENNNPYFNQDNSSSADLWSVWRLHIKNKLLANTKENLWNWGGLPTQLLKMVDAYLPVDLDSYIDKTLPPCYIHGDLTDENILGDIIIQPKKKKLNLKQLKIHPTPNNKKLSIHSKKQPTKAKQAATASLPEEEEQVEEEEIWQANKLIDFGDSNFGDRYYELVSLHLSIFAGDKNKLRSFLKCYEVPSTTSQPTTTTTKKTWLDVYNENPSQFIKRCMCYTLIHHCNALTTIVRHVPDCLNANTMEELARLIYDIDYIIGE